MLLASCCTGAFALDLEQTFRSFLDGLKARGQSAVAAAVGANEVRVASLADRVDSLPLGKGQAVVFVADGCGSCPEVTRQLTRLMGSVTVMNLSTSATAREAFALTGAKGVPATVFGRRLLTGYDTQLVQRMIVDEMQDKGTEAAREGGA
ncbi:MAG: hypothetical protein JNJ71_20500 [Rubrivivax sp.]|nr:hypothetical protein [Rubrivivax sp.]